VWVPKAQLGHKAQQDLRVFKDPE